MISSREAHEFVAGPAYQGAVRRALVHKAAVSDVFVTGSRPSASGDVLVAGELPRTHSYYSDLGGFPVRPDLMPLLELCRQAYFVLAHRCHDVPLGRQFVLQSMSAALSDPSGAAAGPGGYGPLRVLLQCSPRELRERRGVLTAAEWGFAVGTPDGAPFASAAISMTWMPDEVWEAMRTRMRAAHGVASRITYARPPLASVDAAEVGREGQRNVVITDVRRRGAETEADVLVDLCHAGLFDHYTDHVSGMVEAEAVRQLALLHVARAGGRPARGLRVRGVELHFSRVGELDLPLVVATRPDPDDAAGDGAGGRRLRVRVAQAGNDIAHGSVVVEDRDDGPVDARGADGPTITFA